VETTKAGINRRTAAPLLRHGFHRAALEALDLDRLRSNGYALHLPPPPRVSPPVPQRHADKSDVGFSAGYDTSSRGRSARWRSHLHLVRRNLAVCGVEAEVAPGAVVGRGDLNHSRLWSVRRYWCGGLGVWWLGSVLTPPWSCFRSPRLTSRDHVDSRGSPSISQNYCSLAPHDGGP